MQAPAGCGEFRRLVSRREVLRAGVLGAGGLSLAQLLEWEAQGAAAPTDRSVIILWMRGGPSQHETWDPKPEAPAEYRGAFGAISSTVPGIQLVDLLPRCASIMDKWSIVRSLYHDNAGHSAGDQILFTGHPPGPNPDANIFPSCGSIVAKQLGHLTPELPPYVVIPRQVPGTDAAYLGAGCRPFETEADPANRPFTVRGFQRLESISTERFDERRSLLENFDRVRLALDRTGQMDAVSTFQQRAWTILTSSRAAEAFNVDAEPEAVRARYGFQPTYDPGASNRCSAAAFSQRMLLARRLVEAGVRLVTVDCRWWDTHVEGFDSMQNGFLPRWDQCYSALIEDLEERGLLKSTLVVAWGEFGRTPKVNNDRGRDHYPNVFSAALAGGPIQGGRVLGSSDSKGAFPLENPKQPQDVLATIYRHLGIDTQQHYLNEAGRPIPVLPFGEPLWELMST
jgi:uncharacterized protein (DUF1501 family)